MPRLIDKLMVAHAIPMEFKFSSESLDYLRPLQVAEIAASYGILTREELAAYTLVCNIRTRLLRMDEFHRAIMGDIS